MIAPPKLPQRAMRWRGLYGSSRRAAYASTTVESDCTDVGRSKGKRRKKRITPYMDLTITAVRKSRILPRGGRIWL